MEDSSHVVSLYQSEVKIYARSVKGRFNNWRWLIVWATQLVFYGLPWISINQRQAVLFDLGARRFYIFNLVLYPQDLIYLTGLLVICAFCLFLFTAIAGRLWCGYACPQTVYTEIFMWVERKLEGDRIARMKRDSSSFAFENMFRKFSKHSVWIIISLWTGFTFVGYFTPILSLSAEVLSTSLGPWESFWIGFYGLATYGNAGWMREQVCKYMCPYARFQSAMFDRDTLIVTYDEKRGEQRGSRPRADSPAVYQSKGLGDCIDCGLCVQVCPTGIDIRKGLQYECISCSACVDVCNGVMEKMHYPLGLIKNSTQNGIDQNLSNAQIVKRVFRPRVLIYSAVLLAISIGLLTSLALRNDFKVDVVRDRGTVMQIGEGLFENTYRLQIMNATEQEQTYLITASGLNGLTIVSPASPTQVNVDSASSRWISVRLQAPTKSIEKGSHPIEFSIQSQSLNKEIIHEKSVFLTAR
jgi:cytochrome c oxidase accessory protein FixG